LQPDDIDIPGTLDDARAAPCSHAPDTWPEEVPMSDDQREREPLRDQGDNPPEAGVRSDLGGTSSGDATVAPGGADVDRIEEQAEPGDAKAGAGAHDPLADVEHPTADE
jgi:hypothetical protein